jgi:hypothetical protein
LAHTGLGGEVVDVGDVLESFLDCGRVAYVSED